MPTASWLTKPTSEFSRLRVGKRWPPRARRRSAFCGPAPAPRIPNYRDVIYIEELIGPDTVNTFLPRRSTPSATTASPAELTEDVEGARKTMADLAAAGIIMKDVTDKLTADGVKLFADAFDTLLAAVEKNTTALRRRK